MPKAKSRRMMPPKVPSPPSHGSMGIGRLRRRRVE
jgi:hypothetical protein